MAQIASSKLVRGSELEVEEISSAVVVRADALAARGDIAALRGAGVRECIARVLGRQFGGKAIRSARWGRFTVATLPVSAPGTDATIGFRLTAILDFPVSEVTVPIYFDVLGFVSGPAEVALYASSATQPVPGATERRLLLLLAARAEAHRL